MSDVGDESLFARPDGELPEGPEFELGVLASAADQVLRDLRETFASELDMDVYLDSNKSTVCRFFDSGELSMPLDIDVSDDVASTIVTLAAKVQDSDVFYDHLEPWPRCPIHPAERHSMRARRFGNEAWWACPVASSKVARVGELVA